VLSVFCPAFQAKLHVGYTPRRGAQHVQLMQGLAEYLDGLRGGKMWCRFGAPADR